MCCRSLLSLSVIVLYLYSAFPNLAHSPQVRPTAVSGAEQRERGQTDTADKNPDQARAALTKGQDLLRRNRTDQALVWLNTALRLLKQTGDVRAEAAVHDALGDLYTQVGQYRLALPEYQRAQEMLRAANYIIDANLLTAKLGGLYYLMGKTTEAGAAYEQMNAGRQDVAAGVNAGVANDSSISPAPLVVAASSDEQRTLDLINGERRAKGLSPLLWDNLLVQMARSHSQNMVRFGFSGHTDQNGLGTEARAKAFGIRAYEVMGENISTSEGAADPVAFAIENWIKPGNAHRDLILNAKFTYTGLGIAQAADGRTLFTQVFLARSSATNSAVRLAAGQDKRTESYRAFISYANSEFGLGRLAYTGGRLDEAQRHFENVLAAADANSPMGKLAQPRRFRAAALTSLGDVALRRADYSEALSRYGMAAGGARNDERLDLLWAAQHGTGRTYWAMAAHNPDVQKASALRVASLAAYKQAISTIEDFLLGSIHSDEARKTFLSTTQTVFAEASSVQAEMALMTADPSSASLEGIAQTYAATALQAVEQGRARALLDLLGETRVELTDGIAPALLQQKARIQARQLEIAASINGVRLGDELTLPAAAALEAESDKLELQYISVEKQIRASSPRYAALTRPQPLTVSEIQQGVLDDDTVLLEYNLGDENSYLWVVTRGGLKLFKLPARSLVEAKAQEFRSQLIPASLRRPLSSADDVTAQTARGLGLGEAQSAPAVVKPYLMVAYDLYRVLVEPAAPYIRDKRLLIVAAGSLHFIPFGALVTNNTGDSYDTLAYLIKSNEIIYTPAASVLAAIRRPANSPAGRGQVLIMADPVFDAADPRAAQSASRPEQSMNLRSSLRFRSALEDLTGNASGEIKLLRLPGTRVEAEQIAKFATASGSSAATMLDLNASETTLGQQNLRQYGILHFATHGILDPVRPQFTGLVLSMVGDKENDGFLQVGEIFNLRLHSSLVMLSACETGLGELQRGEGVSGLTQGFMYAGASTVGVTLWSISDAATAELMPGFYKRLVSKENPSTSASLRTAQLELIAGKRYSSPFYWAPFILLGDWR